MGHINHASTLHLTTVHHTAAVPHAVVHHATVVHVTAVHTAVVHTSLASTLPASGPLIPAPSPPFPLTPALTAVEVPFGTAYANAHGGLLPVDAFWEYMIYRHDSNPAAFDAHNPVFAALLDRNQSVTSQNNLLNPPPAGLVPNTPYWNYLRYRHDVSPFTFDHFHPQLAALLDEDEILRHQTTPPPVTPPPVTPPPVMPPASAETITTIVGTVLQPGISTQIPGGQSSPPIFIPLLVPSPTSAVPMTTGLLVVFFAHKWGRGLVRMLRHRLGLA